MSLEQQIEVGPFTPQEVDKVCSDLSHRKVAFELLKDIAKEKEELLSDYQNLILKAEYRTETYLGQIFFLRLNREDFHKHADLFSELGMSVLSKVSDANLEHPKELQTEDMGMVHRKSVGQKKFQALAAVLIILMIIVLTMWSFLSGSNN